MPADPVAIQFGLPPREAIAALLARRELLPDDYYMLPAAARRQAFMIAGLAGVEQIRAVRDKLADVLLKGGSFDDFKAYARTLPDWKVTPGRLETIYRNAVQQAYNDGAWQRFERAKRRRPYLMYSAINDSRTRPAHRALSGIIRPVDDPFWRSHSPPLGHRCRCRLLNLTEAEARARSGPNSGLNKRETAQMQPDAAGWGVRPEGREPVLRQRMAERAAQAGPQVALAAQRYLDDLPAFAPAARVVGEVGEDFRQAVADALLSIPDPVRLAVDRAGYKVLVGRTLVEIETRLAGQPVPGQLGVIWDQIDGATLGSDRLIAVGEFALDARTGRLVAMDATRAKAVLRHEHGHALDLTHGLSQSALFMAAYDADVARIRALKAAGEIAQDDVRDIDYLLQAPPRGPQEAFADLFASLDGLGTAAYIHVADWMPTAARAVRRIVRSIRD